MLLVFWFGVIGIMLSRETEAYQDLIGLPVTLVVLSSAVIVSITIRLIIRYLSRFSA